MLMNIVLIASGVVAGAIVALTVIAPKTKNTTDDAVLEKLKSLETILQSIVPKA